MKNFLSNIHLTKKQILFIAIPIVIIAIALAVYLIFFQKENTKDQNENTTQQLEGYANDVIEDPSDIYQTIEASDITYDIYGEVGLATGSEEPEYSSITLECENGYDETEILLSDEPVEVNNHCIVNFVAEFNTARDWNDDESEFTQNPELNMYADLPDGSLLTFSDAAEFQINIYDNETRVVINDGVGYFRIAQQEEGKIFTVQVGDKVYKTEGGTELYVYAVGNINGTSAFETESSVFTDTEGYEEFMEYFSLEGTEYEYLYLAGMKTISGDGEIYQRGTTETIEKSENEYRFAYYYKYTYTADSKGEGYTRDANEIPELISIGTYVSNDLDETLGLNTNNSSREYFALFVQDQKALNKIGMGFENITTNSNDDIEEMMEEYIAYYMNLGEEELARREANDNDEDNPCSGIWYLEGVDNCGCKTGWTYIKEAQGCCPNGYTYSSSLNKCITTITTYSYSCPSGTYSVGTGKCCKTGYTLSSDGTSCVSTTSKTNKTIVYSYTDSAISSGSSSSSSGTSDSAGCTTTPMCWAMDDSYSQNYGCPGGSPVTNHYINSKGECCFDLECVE